MKQLAVISGKGGTGKTTITAALAALSRGAVLADCDVDAPDLHLILQPTPQGQQPFHGLQLARIDESVCIECGACLDRCRFDAITDEYDVVREKCEGCAVCELVCPVDAITMVDRVSGTAYTSMTRYGPMSHATLGIGEEASGRLVTLVRKNAVELAERHGRDLVIIDGPPGIGCPVIAAITGVDLVLVVAEPSLSSLHDLERVLGVVEHFGIPAAVCVNKADINPGNVRTIAALCGSRGARVVGLLPYDEGATAAMIAGRTLPEYSEGGGVDHIRRMWSELQILLTRG